jgi:hypothetical protein
MKHKSILKRFSENGKWKDYINRKAFEVRISVVFTLIILIMLGFLDVFNNFSSYLSPIQNITLNIATALIGMLGTILAGIAIIISILNKDVIKLIENLNSKKSIQKVLVSFEFLAFNIIMGIILYYILHFVLYVPKPLVPLIIFYLILGVCIYFFLFIIFYTISLIGNSIRVFIITNTYSDILEEERNLYDLSNEIRIDYIFNMLLNDQSITNEDFIKKLNDFVEMSNIKNKEEVKNYLKQYYKA